MSVIKVDFSEMAVELRVKRVRNMKRVNVELRELGE